LPDCVDFENENTHNEFDSFIYTALPPIGTIAGLFGKASTIKKASNIKRYQHNVYFIMYMVYMQRIKRKEKVSKKKKKRKGIGMQRRRQEETQACPIPRQVVQCIYDFSDYPTSLDGFEYFKPTFCK
jgi:hypothetical protein